MLVDGVRYERSLFFWLGQTDTMKEDLMGEDGLIAKVAHEVLSAGFDFDWPLMIDVIIEKAGLEIQVLTT